MIFLWPIVSGVLFVPFGFYEVFRWIFSLFRGNQEAYPSVNEIWMDRSSLELACYVVGQIFFLGWPLCPALLHLGSPETWRIVAIIQWFAFVLLTFLTLMGPIGVRKRYHWLMNSHRTGQERLFVGQVPGRMFLKTSGTGTDALMREFIAIVVILIMGPALVNYSAWYDMGIGAYNIPNKEEAKNIDFPDFVYQSVVTITTTGFGDITPKETAVQFVSVTQIFLGWMYLIALFPLLLSSVQRNTSHEIRWHRRKSARGGLLGTAISSGINSLVDQRSAAGAWSSKLSLDLTTSYFSLWAIERAVRYYTIAPSIMATLEKQISSTRSSEKDNLTDFLGEVHGRRDNKKEIEKIYKLAFDIFTPKVLQESHENFLKWFSLILFLESSQLTCINLLSLEPPVVDDWKNQYGSHWSTYALAARLVFMHLKGNDCEVDVLSSELVRVRDQWPGSGSWFGDCLLTSLCVLALIKADRQRTTWHSAILWLAEVAKEQKGISLFRNLDVWHTALALEVLHFGGEVPETAIQWLIKQFQKTSLGNGWSWSSESKDICLDSTSTVVHAFMNLDVKDVRVHRCIEEAKLSLFDAKKEITKNSLGMPTFIENIKEDAMCPIIFARSLRLWGLPPNERRLYAESLAQEIVDGFRSPWFKHPGISVGLVLWYLCIYLSHESNTLCQLVETLVNYAKSLSPDDHVTRASILLGLLASSRILAKREDIIVIIEQLVDDILVNQEDGGWPREFVGVFGFGRLYADDHFATVLSLRALMEYASD